MAEVVNCWSGSRIEFDSVTVLSLPGIPLNITHHMKLLAALSRPSLTRMCLLSPQLFIFARFPFLILPAIEYSTNHTIDSLPTHSFFTPQLQSQMFANKNANFLSLLGCVATFFLSTHALFTNDGTIGPRDWTVSVRYLDKRREQACVEEGKANDRA